MDEDNKICPCSCQTSSLCMSFGSLLWSVAKGFFVSILFIIFGCTILTGLFLGVITFLVLPNSHHLEKDFLRWYLIFAPIFVIVSICLTRRAKKIEKQQSAKPCLKYLGARLRVSRYMEKTTESGASWIQEILSSVKQSIANNLDGCQEEEANNLSKVEDMLNTLHMDLLGDVTLIEESKMLKKAIFFALKEKTINHPGDLQGRRRCFILVELFSKLTDTSQSRLPSWFHSYLKPLLNSWYQFIKSFVSYFLSFCEGSSSSDRKYSTKSIRKSVTIISLFTLVPVMANTLTDLHVLALYCGLWTSSGDLPLQSIITGWTLHEDPKFSAVEVFVPTVFLSVFFTMSLLLTVHTNPIKKMICQFKVKMRMSNPHVEKNNEILSTPSVMERHDMIIDQSILESPYQCVIQMGIFLYLVPYVIVIKEMQKQNSLLSGYHEKLNFLDNFLFSGITSVFSLTMGQIQQNSVFSEFNISWIQWILFCLASFCSTLTFLLVLITSFEGLLGAFGGYTGGYFSISFLIAYTFLLLSIGPFITRFTRSEEDRSKLPSSSSSWLTSTLTTFLLPPSQHVTRGHFNLHHNPLWRSPQLLCRAAEQCGTYFLVIIISLALNSCDYLLWPDVPLDYDYVRNITINSTIIDFTLNSKNSAIIDYVRSSSLNSTNSAIIDLTRYQCCNVAHRLPQSAISAARHNVMVATMVFLPFGLIMSYVFLSAYYVMDKGFFTGVNVGYFLKEDVEDVEDKKECCGEDHEHNRESNGENNQGRIDPGQEESFLIDNIQSNLGNNTESKTINITEENALDAWIDRVCPDDWIDRDFDENWLSLSKIWSWLLGKDPKHIKKWNLKGSWLDLTGDDGLEGNCIDGTAVLEGAEGSLEHSIKLSFPYYRNQRKRVTCCPSCSNRCSCCSMSCYLCFCCMCYKNKDLVDEEIEGRNNCEKQGDLEDVNESIA